MRLDLAPDGTLTVPQQCRAEQCDKIAQDVSSLDGATAALSFCLLWYRGEGHRGEHCEAQERAKDALNHLM